MGQIKSIINQLSSDSYTFSHYWKDNKRELEAKETPQRPVYTYQTISKTARIAREVLDWALSILFLPYGVYRLLQWVGGRIIVPAQTDPYSGVLRKKLTATLSGLPASNFTYNHNNFKKTYLSHESISKLQQEMVAFDPVTKTPYLKEGADGNKVFMAKRISIRVDGKLVDAMIFGKKGNLDNRKWSLVSNGNGSTLESILALQSETLVEQINKLGVNFLLYNYRGVAGSEGLVTRNGMINSHKGMVRFLEDEKRGIGAKEIIQIGVSIGGGVQGEAMKAHKLLDKIKYVFVKYLTFSKISKVPKNPFLGFLMRILDWEFSSVASSRTFEKCSKPEIVIQRACNLFPTTASMIESDGLIHAKSSYAFNLLSQPIKSWRHKKFIGVSVKHFESPQERLERNQIIQSIKHSLSRHYRGFDVDASRG